MDRIAFLMGVNCLLWLHRPLPWKAQSYESCSRNAMVVRDLRRKQNGRCLQDGSLARRYLFIKKLQSIGRTG